MHVLALLLAVATSAADPTQSQAVLRKEEQALRKVLADPGGLEQADIDLDGNRFERWTELAHNLEKQGRVDEAIEAMYRGAGEIPTRSADFRATARWALSEAVKFEERLKGPSESTTAATWSAAISVQRGRSPVDRLADDKEPFFGGYLEGTIVRLGRIGRPDEAHALAAGALGIATSFRNRPAQGSRDEAYERDRRLFAERRGQLHMLVKTAFALSGAIDSSRERDLLAAEALLAAGDAAGAETAFRTMLGSMPRPIVVSAVRSRATRGLARALAAQGGDKRNEALRIQRTLLRQLIFQSWREDPRLADVGAELVALLDSAGLGSDAERLRADMAAHRVTAALPRFLR